MKTKTKAFIFDLDGVIVDTAKFHFQAWKRLANGLGIDFDHEQNEQLKGVSRVNSLKKILDWGNTSVSEEEFIQLMDKKNEDYLTYVDAMDESEILPQVKEKLQLLKDNNIPIALGSASKNARRILDKINLTPFFDEIVDGTNVTKAKPDPEVFLVKTILCYFFALQMLKVTNVFNRHYIRQCAVLSQPLNLQHLK